MFTLSNLLISLIYIVNNARIYEYYTYAEYTRNKLPL